MNALLLALVIASEAVPQEARPDVHTARCGRRAVRRHCLVRLNSTAV